MSPYRTIDVNGNEIFYRRVDTRPRGDRHHGDEIAAMIVAFMATCREAP